MHRLKALLLAIFLGCSGGGGGSEGTGGAALPVEGVSLEFGTVAPGTPVQGSVVLRNAFDAQPATITDLRVSSAQLTIDAGALSFPIRIGAGETFAVPVTWTPVDEGFFSETLRVDTEGHVPVFVAISGTVFEQEQTVDFGLVPFRGGRVTDELEVDVPANAVSFAIEVLGGSVVTPTGGALYLESLIGPSGKVYVDATAPFSGPYSFERSWPAAQLFALGGAPWVPVNHTLLLMPNTDSPDAQLEPGGGRYRFRLSNTGGSLTSAQVRVIIESRASSSATGRVDVNVFLASGLIATAQTAPTHPHLQSLLLRTNAVLGQARLALGAIDYYKLTDPRFDVGDALNPGPLFRQSAMASRARLNVFLVMSGTGGVAGLSGAIPGPRALGSPIAGVFAIGNDAINPNDLGTVLAHEICHYLGLNHTREATGNGFPWTYDNIDDTCPGTACVGSLPQYLMDANFNPITATLLTPGQIAVMRGHPLVNLGAGTSLARRTMASDSPLLATARLVNAACGCRN